MPEFEVRSEALQVRDFRCQVKDAPNRTTQCCAAFFVKGPRRPSEVDHRIPTLSNPRAAEIIFGMEEKNSHR